MKKSLSFLKVSLVCSALFCVGCGTMIADHIVSGYPSFQDVSKKWPKIREGCARVIIYFPRQGAIKSFNPLELTGGVVSLPIVIDKDTATTIGDRTFVFADLEEGRHTVAFAGLHIFNRDTMLKIDVHAGEVVYIEITRTHMNDNPPRIVDETVALQALTHLHHNYMLPLPFPDQPKRAVRAM